MLAKGYGRIINTASMASLLVPHPQKQVRRRVLSALFVRAHTEGPACMITGQGVMWLVMPHKGEAMRQTVFRGRSSLPEPCQ